MTAWEYYVLTLSPHEGIQDHLDDLGKQGWELVTAVLLHSHAIQYTLKRQVQER